VKTNKFEYKEKSKEFYNYMHEFFASYNLSSSDWSKGIVRGVNVLGRVEFYKV